MRKRKVRVTLGFVSIVGSVPARTVVLVHLFRFQAFNATAVPRQRFERSRKRDAEAWDVVRDAFDEAKSI